MTEYTGFFCLWRGGEGEEGKGTGEGGGGGRGGGAWGTSAGGFNPGMGREGLRKELRRMGEGIFLPCFLLLVSGLEHICPPRAPCDSVQSHVTFSPLCQQFWQQPIVDRQTSLICFLAHPSVAPIPQREGGCVLATRYHPVCMVSSTCLGLRYLRYLRYEACKQ